MLAPFFFHWKDGVEPPLTGVAENVTRLPEQMVFPKSELIETAGTSTGLTVMVILLLEAVVGVAHNALLVKTHEIISAFIKLEIV